MVNFKNESIKGLRDQIIEEVIAQEKFLMENRTFEYNINGKLIWVLKEAVRALNDAHRQESVSDQEKVLFKHFETIMTTAKLIRELGENTKPATLVYFFFLRTTR